MKITKEQELKFALQYSACINQLVKWLSEVRNHDVTVLHDFDFKHDHNFEDIAKEMFLEDLKQFYDHHHAIEAAVQVTKSIISK